MIWHIGVWVEAQINLPLTQVTYIPQFGMYHKSGNKRKMEINILDIFQRGKAKSLEVGSFYSVLHSNCTFYPERSSTSHITTISTLLDAAMSRMEHRRGRLNTSKGMGAKMLTGKGSIPKCPQEQLHPEGLAHCMDHLNLFMWRTGVNLIQWELG